MVAGMSNAANLIGPSSNKRKYETPNVTARSKKQQKAKETEDIEQEEHDGLFVGNTSVSVGTVIKRKALQLLKESNIKTLSARERKIMT